MRRHGAGRSGRGALARGASEAIANLLATPLRFVAIVVLLGATLAWAGYTQAHLVRDLQQRKADQAAQGQYVAVASAVDTASTIGTLGSANDVNGVDGADSGEADQAAGGILAAACDALAARPGVAAAGVFASAGTAVITSEPDGGFELWHISPGAARYLGAAGSTAGVLIGAHAAAELGVATGSTVRVQQFATSSTVHVIPAQGPRTAAFDRAVLTVLAPTKVTGTCYVDVPGSDPNTTAAWLAPALGDAATITVMPLVNRGALGNDPVTDYQGRAVLWVAPTAPLLALLAWLLLLRARRAELAIPRIFGASRAMLAWQLLVEFLGCLIVALPPTVAAVAAGSWGDRVAAAAGTSAVAAGVALVTAVAVPTAYLMTIRRGTELAALRGAE